MLNTRSMARILLTAPFGYVPLPVDAAVAEEQQKIGRTALSPLCPWAELMKRVFAIDVSQCDRCGGFMRFTAAIHSPEVSDGCLRRGCHPISG